MNYTELKNNLFTLSYMYLDYTDGNTECQSFKLFRDMNIHVKIKSIWLKRDRPYNIIICKVKKKDKNKFINAMKQLKNNMLLLGFTDYEDCTSKEIKSIISNYNEMYNQEVI